MHLAGLPRLPRILAPVPLLVTLWALSDAGSRAAAAPSRGVAV